ncbi:protein kinase [Mucilaginibacter sp. ZT4R22]|uniref:Protein kinase n=1 Tax=Mucilaginibacter pankratovii TaxID=2772110 RepID=A0ABR7WNW5_9SPHI|nr:protein kinase [Mucilaginibacter pankratovii]MBD1363858.1 protein kinase [Mucilaginibacter pankratovii]
MSEDNKITAIVRQKWPDAEYIGFGGNSYVYKVTMDKDEIAIKFFRYWGNNSRYQRFSNEMNTIQKFNKTDGIVPVLFVSNEHPKQVLQRQQLNNISDLAYYGMPLFPGNLSTKIEEIATDDATLAVKTCLEIALIVKRLHDEHHAHRDLKPENTLIDKDGKLYISDFGLCIDLSLLPDPDHRLSTEGEMIGSISYRASELLRGRLDASDHKPSDVYALGRILWALVVGKEPHGYTDLEFKNYFIGNCGRPIKKAQLLDDIIKAATGVDPVFRLKIDDFIQFLEQWLNNDMQYDSKSIVSSILNSEEGIKRLRASMTTAEIYDFHNNTMEFIKSEWASKMSVWQSVIDVLRTRNIGNILSIDRRDSFISDVTPEILGFKVNMDRPNFMGLGARLGLGLPGYPFFDLGFYYFLDLDKYENQYYFVVPAVTYPGETNAKLAMGVVGREFDYRSQDIRQLMLTDLFNAFDALDKIFMQYIK